MYHEGKVSATSPKILLLLDGKILISYRHNHSNDITRKEVNAPAVLEIPANITHNIKALEDFIILECNSRQDLENDRVQQEV